VSVDGHNELVRARLRGLVRNPAIPAGLLRRLAAEHLADVEYAVTFRETWTAEQLEALVAHPDGQVRELVARALHITPEQRARLVEDPAPAVLAALAEGPISLLASTWQPRPALPAWAYERLLERSPKLALFMCDSPWLPPDLRRRLWPAEPAPAANPPLERAEAEARTADANPDVRTEAAADPRLPADLVARLAADPSPAVRLAVSMRPELSEQQRAAIDYHVAPDDRIRPARWASDTRDPQAQRRCAFSAHVGLRRSVAGNPHLSADLVGVLAADDDFAVRLLLCERHAGVPADTVLATFLQARTATRAQLLDHPNFPRAGLARLADSPDPWARIMVVHDPEAAPELIERLSHDPDPMVRQSTAGDPRLSPARVLEMVDDPSTAGSAAASPHLPLQEMHRILADAHRLR
jgi:hypothetical protein